MTTVLDEIASPDLTRADVARRVDDWKTRIADLYDTLEAWLADDLTADRSTTTPMHEPLMRHVGLAATTVPILTFRRDGRDVAWFVPFGLWIIGANGRVDAFAGSTHALINDRSENFAAPAWRIASSTNRFIEMPLDRASLRAKLAL